jgi:hypothetical protein
VARRREATDQDQVNTDDGRYGVDDTGDESVEDGETADTDTSFTSLENHLFGARYFDEADEIEGEVKDLTTMLKGQPSEADTVVHRNLDEPPPVQVVQVLPPGSRPTSVALEPRASLAPAEPRGGGGLIAASGVFAGFSMVAAGSLVALGLVCAVVVWFALRPSPVAPATPVLTAGPPEPAPAEPVPSPEPGLDRPGPGPVVVPDDGSPLRSGVRFPASFAFNDWMPVDVDTQAMFDLLASIEADCAGQVRITGHTDERGAELVNDRIAIARAGEVRRLMEQQGIDRRRMEIGSAGADRPEVDPSDGELPPTDARAQNRRVTVQCR